MANRECKKPCKPLGNTPAEGGDEQAMQPEPGSEPASEPEGEPEAEPEAEPASEPEAQAEPAEPPTGNMSVVLYGVNDLRIEDRPIPEPKPDEVLLRMACVGICGSDVHYLVNGSIGKYVVTDPMLIGHEGSGVVEQLGSEVKTLEVGDRVAIEPGVPCRYCDYCKAGKYNLCPDIVFCATPPVDGNLCQFYTHAADYCYKLPDNVSLEEGALCEPLAVGVHACRRAGVHLGSTVLVMGAGPIGLVTVVVAKAMGARAVMSIDVKENRLEFAKNVGADYILKYDGNIPEKDFVQQIHEILGNSPCKTIECVGNEATMRIAILATKSGGTTVLVGMGPTELNVPLMDACVREVDIRGVFRYCNEYPAALSLLSSGNVDVKQLITHNYQLEEAVQAFETAKTGEGNPIKIIIHCS